MKPLTLLLAALLGNFILVSAQSPLIQWQNCYGSSDQEIGTSIQPTADGGYILAGSTSGNDGDVSGYHADLKDCWVAKLSSTGAIQWSKTLGGSGDETAFAIRQASDGTYWLLAVTTSPTGSGDVKAAARGATDLWLVQLDNSGNIVNQHRYGGINNYFYSNFRLTPDGGMILTASADRNGGDVTGNHGGTDGWVVKVDKNGTIQWQTSVGGSGNDAMADVEVLPDGTYIAVGMSESSDIPGNHAPTDDFFAVRLDNGGRILWQRSYGGSSEEHASGVALASDGGVVMTGSVGSGDGDVIGNHGRFDCWAVAIDINGAIKWQRCYGGSANEYANSITATPDKGYLITGATWSGDGDLSCVLWTERGWVLKIDATGAPGWNKGLGNPDVLSNVQTTIEGSGSTSDGGAIVIGYTNNRYLPRFHGSAGSSPPSDMYVVKLTPVMYTDPSLKLTAPPPACQGGSITITPSSEIIFDKYVWYRNGAEAGVYTSTYTASDFRDGDQIALRAEYSPDDCDTKIVGSNAIKIQLKTTITPAIRIAASQTSVCEGSPVEFTSTTTDGGPGLVYQWMVNGLPVGTGGPSYSSSTLADGDAVSCMVTGDACTLPVSSTSSPIVMTVSPSTQTSLDIRATTLPACKGQLVQFQAVPGGAGAGASPDFQWTVNGKMAGTNSPSFASADLADGDVVVCTASYVAGCHLPATANATAAIEDYPVISPVLPIVLTKGQSVLLDVPVSGAVTSYTWSPATGLSDPTAAMPIASPVQTTHYTLIAATQAGCADTSEIIVEAQMAMGIPSAFSPNGDGKNDIFYVVGGVYGCMVKDLTVFDRWGSCVFQVHNAPTNDPAYGWTGNGAPAGAYVYFIRLTVPGSKDQLYRGTLMLVR